MNVSDLPWDCQLRIIKHLDIDARLVLGVPPGRLRVPLKLQGSMRCFPRIRHRPSFSKVDLGRYYTLWSFLEKDGVFRFVQDSESRCFCGWSGRDLK